MNAKKTLKVRIEVLVEVDRDAYELAYGIREAAQIRNDVKYAAFSALSPEGGVWASDGGIVNAELLNA